MLGASGLASCPPAQATVLKHVGSTSSFPIPASERVHGQTVKSQSSTPATSTTFYNPTTRTDTTAKPSTLTGAKSKPATRGKRHKSQSLKLSQEAIVALILAGVLIVLCLIWGAIRWLAFEPRWMLSARHSLDEASFRISASLAEFADWIRLGR